MFFGQVISQSKPFAFTPENVSEEAGEVLSLTNVVLAPSSKEGGQLWIKKDNEEYLIASLSK